MCLMLKLLQLQPEKEIIVEFIKNEDYKYVRILGGKPIPTEASPCVQSSAQVISVEDPLQQREEPRSMSDISAGITPSLWQRGRTLQSKHSCLFCKGFGAPL